MRATNVMQKWIIPLKGGIQLLCILFIVYNSVTTTRATTTRIKIDDDDPNPSTLTEREIDEQILRDLNNLNIKFEAYESKELSIEEVMSPEDQLLYMKEINNIVRKHKYPDVGEKEIVTLNTMVDSDCDKVTTPDKNLDKDEKQADLHEKILFDIISSIPDQEVSSILSELMPAEQYQEVKNRISQIFPEAASKGFDFDKIQQFLETNDLFLGITNNEKKGSPNPKVSSERKYFATNKRKNKKDKTMGHTSSNGVLTIIKPPCIDLFPNRCINMKNEGYCFKPDKISYMHKYCPLSCDICNPHIQKTLTGVPQKYNFLKVIKENKSTNALIEKRARNIMVQTTKYYKQGIENNQDEYQRAQFQMCKNRHHSCAVLAILGFCETHPESMAVTCGPSCRLCHFKVQHERKIASYEVGQEYFDKFHFDDTLKVDVPNAVTSFGTSPFLRGDIIGIFEAIEANRVVKGWRTATITNYNKKRNSGLKFAQLEKLSPIVHKYDNTTDKYKAYLMQTKKNDRVMNIPVHNSGPVIIQFDNFLNAKECKALLDLARLLQINHKTNIDGFEAHTTDAYVRDDGKLHIVRSNSRKYILPYINDNDATSKKDPIIQQIFDRIEVITGVPQSHIEIPLQFDKFTNDQFQEAQFHGVQQSMAENAIENFLHESKIKIERKPGINPRFLGLSIFLNDDFMGGDVSFPKLSKVRIKPKLGLAILYPCLLSLDEWEKSMEDHLSSSSTNSDMKESTNLRQVLIKNKKLQGKTWDQIALEADELLKIDENGKDDGHNVNIPEDNDHLRRLDTTIISHLKVKRGVKYTLNIFLRLDPYLSQNN